LIASFFHRLGRRWRIDKWQEKGDPSTPSIDEVRVRFEQWRQARHGRARIPDELWAEAAGVARKEGVNETAAAERGFPACLWNFPRAVRRTPDRVQPRSAR